MLPSLVVGEHSSGTLFSELWQAIFFHITCDNELNDIHFAPPVSEYFSCIALRTICQSKEIEGIQPFILTEFNDETISCHKK